jgi:hypothetical protein
MCITGDNASNNLKMIEFVANKLDIINPEEIFVGCFAHILNLSMQEILQNLGAGSCQETKNILNQNEEAEYLSAISHLSPIQKVLMFA